MVSGRGRIVRLQSGVLEVGASDNIRVAMYVAIVGAWKGGPCSPVHVTKIAVISHLLYKWLAGSFLQAGDALGHQAPNAFRRIVKGLHDCPESVRGGPDAVHW